MISLNRHIFYGPSKNYGPDILDISKKEILTFFPLVFLIIALGFAPNLLLDLFDNNSNYLINIMENLN
jgi:NADH:ubiquinone oxidoreductase subunit 4 (subunit M)